MWYENAINGLEPGKIYRRTEIVSILKKEKDGMSENSYIWVIGDLVKQGFLQHEGRNQYSLEDGRSKEEYSPFYSETAQTVPKRV